MPTGPQLIPSLPAVFDEGFQLVNNLVADPLAAVDPATLYHFSIKTKDGGVYTVSRQKSGDWFARFYAEATAEPATLSTWSGKFDLTDTMSRFVGVVFRHARSLQYQRENGVAPPAGQGAIGVMPPAQADQLGGEFGQRPE